MMKVGNFALALLIFCSALALAQPLNFSQLPVNYGRYDVPMPSSPARQLSEGELLILRGFIRQGESASFVLAYFIAQSDPVLGGTVNSLGIAGNTVSIGLRPSAWVTPQALAALGAKLDAVGLRHELRVVKTTGF